MDVAPTYNTHFPLTIPFLPLPRQLLFCKLFHCFTAAFSVQPQPFYYFSLAKNRSEGPHLPSRLEIREIVRILIHIRIRLNSHLHFLYVYIYLYISCTYFHVRPFRLLFLSIYLYVFLYIFLLTFFRSLFYFYLHIRLYVAVNPYYLYILLYIRYTYTARTRLLYV